MTEEKRTKETARQREWRAKNPEKYEDYQRRYREAHRKEAYENLKAWRKANPEKVKAQKKRYREAHREEICEKKRARRAQKRKEDK